MLAVQILDIATRIDAEEPTLSERARIYGMTTSDLMTLREGMR